VPIFVTCRHIASPSVASQIGHLIVPVKASQTGAARKARRRVCQTVKDVTSAHLPLLAGRWDRLGRMDEVIKHMGAAVPPVPVAAHFGRFGNIIHLGSSRFALCPASNRGCAIFSLQA
jgi:hypothetical protein